MSGRQLNQHDHASLACVEISKAYVTKASAVCVLERFNLTLKPGEIGMLMGPSGCGKTTLLMIAGGILNPDSGQCLISGQNIFNLPQREKIIFRAQHISFLFQQLHLLPALSALDNIALPLFMDGVALEVAREKARTLMIQLGLEIHLSSPLDHLSGGQKQRIAMGRALIREPTLILCDEPTSNLDINSTDTIFSMIRDYAKFKGCTFLISTHDTRIVNHADTVIEFKGLNDYRRVSQERIYE